MGPIRPPFKAVILVGCVGIHEKKVVERLGVFGHGRRTMFVLRCVFEGGFHVNHVEKGGLIGSKNLGDVWFFSCFLMVF